jgi:hypothetical protein
MRPKSLIVDCRLVVSMILLLFADRGCFGFRLRGT